MTGFELVFRRAAALLEAVKEMDQSEEIHLNEQAYIDTPIFDLPSTTFEIHDTGEEISAKEYIRRCSNKTIEPGSVNYSRTEMTMDFLQNNLAGNSSAEIAAIALTLVAQNPDDWEKHALSFHSEPYKQSALSNQED